MVLGIVFFASCSDSDNKDTPKDFNGIYSTTSTDRVLDLKYSNAVFIGKSVDFNSADGKSATLKLSVCTERFDEEVEFFNCKYGVETYQLRVV